MTDMENNNVISLKQFPGTVRDQLTAVSAYCREHSGTTVVIPAGRIHTGGYTGEGSYGGCFCRLLWCKS